jgi:hypothetical protein
MPRYFFNLYDGHKIIPDPDGTELADCHSARAHAFRVMRELRKNREEKTNSWRLIVHDGGETACFELAFMSAGDAMYRYPARCA